MTAGHDSHKNDKRMDSVVGKHPVNAAIFCFLVMKHFFMSCHVMCFV